MAYVPRPRKTTRQRFWSKVDKNGPMILQTQCWLWTAAKTADGYGSFWIRNKADYPHRYSFEIHKGKLPDGLMACHHCDNPPCVNPDHIFAGTAKENGQDCKEKGRHDNILEYTSLRDERAIRALFKAGIPKSDIAKQLMMSVKTVRNVLYERRQKDGALA